MTSQRPPAPAAVEPSLIPAEGWHCSHLFYRFDRAVLGRLSSEQRKEARAELVACLDPEADHATARLQTSIVSGHKADFGLMLMDPDPLKVDAVHQRVVSSALGAALDPTYSFVSITEISEYVPSVEQYAQRLIQEGEVEGSDAYQAKVDAYRRREPIIAQAAADSRLSAVASDVFLPDEQKAKGW